MTRYPNPNQALRKSTSNKINKIEIKKKMT